MCKVRARSGKLQFFVCSIDALLSVQGYRCMLSIYIAKLHLFLYSVVSCVYLIIIICSNCCDKIMQIELELHSVSNCILLCFMHAPSLFYNVGHSRAATKSGTALIISVSIMHKKIIVHYKVYVVPAIMAVMCYIHECTSRYSALLVHKDHCNVN